MFHRLQLSFWLIALVFSCFFVFGTSQNFKQKLEVDKSNVCLLCAFTFLMAMMTAGNVWLGMLKGKNESYLHSADEELYYVSMAYHELVPLLEALQDSTAKHRAEMEQITAQLFDERKKYEKKVVAVEQEWEKNRKRARLAGDLANVREERKLVKKTIGGDETTGESVATRSTATPANLDTPGTLTTLLPGKNH